MTVPRTLTEAGAANGVVIEVQGVAGSTLSSTRTIPYAERYRSFNGLYETPLENLERAAEDEERRQQDAESDT